MTAVVRDGLDVELKGGASLALRPVAKKAGIPCLTGELRVRLTGTRR